MPRSTTLLDLEAVRRTRPRQEPYRWALLEDVFRPHAGAALAATFPRDGFTEVSSDGAAKPYRMAVRNVVSGGPPACQGFAPVWRALIDELRSPDYQQSLATLCGRALEGLRLEIALWRYGPGCFLAPHTDKPEKVVSQIFYLTEGWQSSWGGGFLVLRGPAPGEVVARVNPALGSSVVLERSDHSWHAVEEVRAARAPVRNTVQVVFYR
jgi:hypothetical protein